MKPIEIEETRSLIKSPKQRGMSPCLLLLSLLGIGLAFCIVLSLALPKEIPDTFEPRLSLAGKRNASSRYKVITNYRYSNKSIDYIVEYTGSDVGYGSDENPIIRSFRMMVTKGVYNNVRLQIRAAETYESKLREEIAPSSTAASTFSKIKQEPALNQTETDWNVEIQDEPFSLNVFRVSTGESLFNLGLGSFLLSESYKEIGVIVPRDQIYGIGERDGKFQLSDGNYTLWARSFPSEPLQNGNSPKKGYGYQPIYLQRDASNQFSMVFLGGSGAMNIDYESEQHQLTYKIASNEALDFNILIGDKDPANLTKSYHKMMGRWATPPLWSLGLFLRIRGDYKMSSLATMLENFEKQQLPLESVIFDEKIYSSGSYCTLDEKNFKELRNLLEKYSKRSIISLRTSVHGSSSSSNLIKAYGCFIKNASNPEHKVFNLKEEVYQLDFLHPNTTLFMGNSVYPLNQMLGFSGVFLNTEEYFSTWSRNCTLESSEESSGSKLDLTKRYSCLSTYLSDLVDYEDVHHYYVHNHYSTYAGIAVGKYLTKTTRMPFVLADRASYGDGQYYSLGYSLQTGGQSWEGLRNSITRVMSSNLFGIPMAGAHLCDLSNMADEELCIRWLQVGAFFPYLESGFTSSPNNQAFPNLNANFLSALNASISLRYSILKHIYAVILQSNGSGSIFKPMFYEFPSDSVLYDSNESFNDEQFMLGSALLVAPICYQGTESMTRYFPRTTWYDFVTGERVSNGSEKSGHFQVSSKLNSTAPLFLRGGYIVPSQSVSGINSSQGLPNSYDLRIGIKDTGNNSYQARGMLIGVNNLADSELTYSRCVASKCLIDVSLNGNNENLILKFKAENHAMLEEFHIRSLIFYGLSSNKQALNISINSGPHQKIEVVRGEFNKITLLINTTLKADAEITIFHGEKKSVEKVEYTDSSIGNPQISLDFVPEDSSQTASSVKDGNVAS